MKLTYVAEFAIELMDPDTLTIEMQRGILKQLRASTKGSPAADFVRGWKVGEDIVHMTFNLKAAMGAGAWAALAKEARQMREPMDGWELASSWLGAGGSEGAGDLIHRAMTAAGVVDCTVTFDDVWEAGI